MTVQTLIVDDEPLARERIREMLREHPDIQVRGECRNGLEAVAAIEKEPPDLVFLDIQMPELDGFGVIERIGLTRMPPVIFVTAYDQYAVSAFEANAIDYLLKPFDRQRFDQAVSRALARSTTSPRDEMDERVLKLLERLEARDRYTDRLVVRTTGRVHFVKVDDIDWIEAARNYVKIHASGNTYVMRETLSHIEESLDPERFLRVHRSTVINFDRICKIEPGYGSEWMAELEDGTRLPISRAYRRGKIKALLS